MEFILIVENFFYDGEFGKFFIIQVMEDILFEGENLNQFVLLIEYLNDEFFSDVMNFEFLLIDLIGGYMFVYFEYLDFKFDVFVNVMEVIGDELVVEKLFDNFLDVFVGDIFKFFVISDLLFSDLNLEVELFISDDIVFLEYNFGRVDEVD